MTSTTLFAEKEWIPLSKAATAAGSTVREIHRVIDEHLLPDYLMCLKPVRALSVTGCALARFYFRSSLVLTKDERLAAIRQVAENIRSLGESSLIVRHGFLSIDFTDFLDATENVLAAMRDAEMNIHSDPEILGGEPVFKGTRIPVYPVAAAFDAGDDIQRILKAFPSLNEGLIAAAKAYADAHPKKGRPRSRIEMVGGRVISRKKVSLVSTC